ncbi:hypothetical protein BDV18DRAFT_139652 [Aspergillus unguis]
MRRWEGKPNQLQYAISQKKERRIACRWHSRYPGKQARSPFTNTALAIARARWSEARETGRQKCPVILDVILNRSRLPTNTHSCLCAIEYPTGM